jgi:lipopolysaccharide transport system permease protein
VFQAKALDQAKNDPMTTAGQLAEAHHLRIQPSSGWVSLRLKDLWSYRELLYFFVWRDIKVRYKQTVLGAAWAVIQPVSTMLIFSLFFGRLAKMPSDGIPYPLFAYAALVPWTFFAQGLTQSADSLVGQGNLIKKVYFPRLAIPLSTTSAGLVDFSISFTVLLGLMARYGIHPTRHLIWLPFFLLLAFATSLGAGLWLSALNVRFRDVKYAVPFIVQFWMYATPIVYPSSLLHGRWRSVFALNPMVGVVEGFRWALLGTKTSVGPTIAASAVAALLVLVGGAFYFRRMEKSFADVV